MATSPLLHLLPNELLVKIIEKLPRPQWPAMELIDRKFRDATLLAWGSVREVDIDRDFIYSELKPIEGENDPAYEMVEARLHRHIAQNTESILKKLSERSPFITSLIGLSLDTEYPNLNTTAIQYLSKFEQLETIKFATRKYFNEYIVIGRKIEIFCDVPLINFVEFIESTQSRASLKEIDFEQLRSLDDPMIDANFDRLRAAFANVPTRPLLHLESLSMSVSGPDPLTFIDSIDGSRMTKLSLGNSPVEPVVLTNLINGTPQLQHIGFAIMGACGHLALPSMCENGRQQPNKDLLAALESLPNLTSLGFNSIWNSDESYCTCHRFEAKFKAMLRTIGPQLVNFVFKPGFLPPDCRMGEIRDIIQHDMPCLKSITLDESCAMDPDELRGIADGNELEEIEIFGYNDDNDMRDLNDVMTTIINKSPGLKRFDCIAFFSDHRVVRELGRLSDLIDLRIRADQLIGLNFIAFGQQAFAEKLQVLHLYQIGEFLEPGLIELIGKATQLRELVVDRNVTDRLLEQLAETCPNLEEFQVLSAGGITFDGVQMLVDGCPKLRLLSVENTDRPLASSLKDLKLDRYRKLELC